MSQHIVVQEKKKFVFGWDQPLMSFFLQVHDLTIEEEDDQIIARFGATLATEMYEVEQLVQTASECGLHINYPTQVALYGEKDDGK